jgi:putative aminopeptidase FrvX
MHMELKEIIELTRRLCQAPGISGREEDAASAAEELLAPLGTVERTPLGSVLCTVCPGEPGAPHLMLEAHLDQIGMVVTSVEKGGFLRVANVGGLDRRLLPAAPVTVHARDGRHPAVVASTPPHLCDGKEKPLKMEGVLVDTGLSHQAAREIFAPGDPVTLDSSFVEMGNGRLVSGSQDDRAGCAAVIAAARMLREGVCPCRVTVCLASQEETSGFGAATAAFSLAPDMALVVDVTFGDGVGVKSHECSPLGKGVEIDYAPAVDRRMFDRLRELARREETPWQVFVMGSRTGTDTDLIAASGRGVRCGLLSIPLRNMHTAVETVAAQDILDTARLMAAFAREVK